MRMHRAALAGDPLGLEDKDQPIGRIDGSENTACQLARAGLGKQLERDAAAHQRFELLSRHREKG